MLGTVEITGSAGKGPSMTESVIQPSPQPLAMLFDLDGTLIDSVYQHVLAWQQALSAFELDLSVWKIHRVGMSGGLLVTALLRETGGSLSAEQIRALNLAHAEAYGQRRDTVRALPGARELLTTLTEHRVPWAIAISGLAMTRQTRVLPTAGWWAAVIWLWSALKAAT